jgi:hypothetical protein
MPIFSARFPELAVLGIPKNHDKTSLAADALLQVQQHYRLVGAIGVGLNASEYRAINISDIKNGVSLYNIGKCNYENCKP